MIIFQNSEHKKIAMKSFTSFIVSLNTRIIKNNEFVCINCDGYKVIIDPNAIPDCIEGHKLSDRITCPECNGSGKGNEKQWRNHFKKLKNINKKKNAWI